MLLPPWKIPPIEPCDAITLDGIENLPEAELAELMGKTPAGPLARQMTTAAWTRARVGAPGWRQHMPAPSTHASHFTRCG